jgi:hypothetical protein
MAGNFRVEVTYSRTVTFFVEAESQADVEGYLDAHPDWSPGDTPGLIDHVGDELEEGYYVKPEERVTSNFRITGALDLEEVGQ